MFSLRLSDNKSGNWTRKSTAINWERSKKGLSAWYPSPWFFCYRKRNTGKLTKQRTKGTRQDYPPQRQSIKVRNSFGVMWLRWWHLFFCSRIQTKRMLLRCSPRVTCKDSSCAGVALNYIMLAGDLEYPYARPHWMANIKTKDEGINKGNMNSFLLPPKRDPWNITDTSQSVKNNFSSLPVIHSSLFLVFCSSPEACKFTCSTLGTYHPRRLRNPTLVSARGRSIKLSLLFAIQPSTLAAPFACSQSIGNRRNEDAYNNPTRIGEPRSLPPFLHPKGGGGGSDGASPSSWGSGIRTKLLLAPCCLYDMSERASDVLPPSIRPSIYNHHHYPHTEPQVSWSFCV